MDSREFAHYRGNDYRPTVISHPDDDIPDEVEEVKAEEKPAVRPVIKADPPSDDLPEEAGEKPLTLKMLQYAVDHRNISYNFARLVQKCLGLEGALKDHPTSFSVQDPDSLKFRAGNIVLAKKLGRLSKIQLVDEKIFEKIKIASS